MKKIVLMALMFAAGMGASAQDEGVETTVAADVVSSYIWRGQDCGSAAIQPTLGIGYKGLSLTAWGSYGLVDTNDAKEFDLTLAYTAGGFNIGLTDYWFNAGLDPEVATLSTMPMAPTISSRQTSVTTLVPPASSGLPTSRVTTV